MTNDLQNVTELINIIEKIYPTNTKEFKEASVKVINKYTGLNIGVAEPTEEVKSDNPDELYTLTTTEVVEQLDRLDIHHLTYKGNTWKVTHTNIGKLRKRDKKIRQLSKEIWTGNRASGYDDKCQYVVYYRPEIIQYLMENL